MRLQLVGHSPLGRQSSDGIRHVWQLEGSFPFIESAAFRTRAKIPTSAMDANISAYTTSVSSGCALTAARIPCVFCRTGNSLRFSGPLSAAEISLQNVYMVMYDMEHNAYDSAAGNLREFAYMGQGEPGFAYTQLRQAVKKTDSCMRALGQRVSRHILATSGVVEMVDAFINDLETGFFEGTRITFHYSLHATKRRNDIMPIENIYSHKEIISRLPKLLELTGEKPCVGLLLFKDYCTGGKIRHYSTNEDEIDRVAALLDPGVCRLSLCEFNPCDAVGVNAQVRPDEADRLRERLENKGFQVKLFASFGKEEHTACGLLGGADPDHAAYDTALELCAKARTLISRF